VRLKIRALAIGSRRLITAAWGRFGKCYRSLLGEKRGKQEGSKAEKTKRGNNPYFLFTGAEAKEKTRLKNKASEPCLMPSQLKVRSGA